MDKEQAVREAARLLHDCEVRAENLRAMNTPADPDQRRLMSEELAVASAEESRAYFRLLKAKSDYARS